MGNKIKLADKKSEELKSATQDMFNALGTDDEEVQKEALTKFSEALADDVKAHYSREIENYQNSNHDEMVMSNRVDRFRLTSEEKKFFAEAVEKQKIEGLDELFPRTIIETVMNDLTTEHPLLSAIDTQYTEAAIKYIFRKPGDATAYWDVIPADIKQILLESFGELEMTVSKLSGFIALPKAYFQLGPDWLARYVIAYLTETMKATLEKAVVNGDGKLKPIGLMRKLSGAIDNKYPEKDAVSITELTPKTLGGPRALLAKNKMLNGDISIVINPYTYEEKISPNLFYQNKDTGVWTKLSLPHGEKVIPSYAVPEGKAIIGNLKNYVLAVAGDLSIKKYQETLAIEDMDLYIAKLFATGMAKDPNAFVVLDVSGVTGVTVPDAEGKAKIDKQDTINPKKPGDDQVL